ncbi:sulfite exporter TauE/SafE family protein [Gallibacterium anatis]|uniref:Probable membrane transporter protein n=1 Tax=Gallibacterium anatis 12656/12 TaxID=1195244 RepID=U1H031_9PAST|nr:sulfite exporter TauE/SafE family protein [Gallibacterium anatis]ERF77796.1 membrane protein [Gallibacterium anatis 12656/12]KGQ47267.1 membrane protein [Gallibacterium anatis]
MTLPIIITLVVCGFLSNLMSALFGIGGGVLMVPVLHTMFPEMPLQMVAATSLTIVMGTSVINLIYFIKQKIQIDKKKMIFWSLAMIVGVQIGFYLSFDVPDFVIVTIFVVTLVLLALKTLLEVKGVRKKSEQSNDTLSGILACFFGGGIAGITGIGGGSIMSPLIAQLPSINIRQIAVYTNYMMVIGGIGNLYGYLSKSPNIIIPHSWQVGYVNFSIVAVVVFSSFVMSFFSMKIRGKLKPELSQKLLGLTLLLIASYMLLLQLI